MEFIPIGPEERFRDDGPTSLSILGRTIRVWRDADGAWQAMEMACRHQNHDLSDVAPEGTVVTCPRHGWRYDLSTGDCLTEGWAGLRRFEVKLEDGSLLVSLRPLN